MPELQLNSNAAFSWTRVHNICKINYCQEKNYFLKKYFNLSDFQKFFSISHFFKQDTSLFT